MRAPPYNPAQSKRGSNVGEEEMRGDDVFGQRCDERDVRNCFASCDYHDVAVRCSTAVIDQIAFPTTVLVPGFSC